MIWELSQSWLASADTRDARKRWLTKGKRYPSMTLCRGAGGCQYREYCVPGFFAN
jgi:hypothetical protein